MSSEMPADRIQLPDAPVIAGLTFRACRSEADYAHVADVMNACREADGSQTMMTRADMTNVFVHMTYFVPAKDLIFAEMDDQPIGYTRLMVRKLDDGRWVYTNIGSVLPQWRRQGIGRALHHYGERRLREGRALEHAALEGHRGEAEALERAVGEREVTDADAGEPARGQRGLEGLHRGDRLRAQPNLPSDAAFRALFETHRPLTVRSPLNEHTFLILASSLAVASFFTVRLPVTRVLFTT